MFQASSRERESVSDLEALRSSLRAFARLRQSAEAGADGSSLGLRVEDDTAGPEPLPLDLSKTFVGPNGTYYDESWRQMEWRGAHRSWNWAAALSLGGWLAYRRLYDHAALHAVWLILLILLALSGTPIRLLLMIQVIVAVLLGVYGNGLIDGGSVKRRRRPGVTMATTRRSSPCWSPPAVPIIARSR